ncbi:MAG TPA: hypothetical protein VJX94_29770 [Stellaceae bacterium]|nr:hypothetical protein [Stellaceae bacterium]
MTATLLILLKVAVAGIILAIGMDSTLRDATYLWRRPGLLLRSVLAMYVLVPLAALALVKVLTLAPGSRSPCWCLQCRPGRRCSRAS